MSASSTEGAWVTERELLIRGFNSSDLRRGRDSGRLRYTPLGPDSFAYREQDVQSWLADENGASKGRTFVKTPAAQSPTTGQVPRAINQPTRQTAIAGGAKATWQQAVNLAMDGGLSRADAVARVDREQPGLREAMIAEHNRR